MVNVWQWRAVGNNHETVITKKKQTKQKILATGTQFDAVFTVKSVEHSSGTLDEGTQEI